MLIDINYRWTSSDVVVSALSLIQIFFCLSFLSAGYHTIHWQVLGVHDDSSETGEAHLAQQHSEVNGNVVVDSGETVWGSQWEELFIILARCIKSLPAAALLQPSTFTLLY